MASRSSSGIGTLVVLFLCGGLQAQVTSHANGQVSVPLVGCKSDGQAGPVEAPASGTVSVGISKEAGQKLSYYKAVLGVGMLAPRNWSCFCTYGSSGSTLFVSANAIDTSGGLNRLKGLSGPAVQLSYRSGDSSGRFIVAEIVARVFPAYRSLAVNVMDGFDVPESKRVFGPYPKDILSYRSETIVEFVTPAHTDGLGTHSFLPKNDRPIRGVAILVGQAPDLLHLSLRLPAAMTRFASTIIEQLEFDAAHLKSE